MNRERPDLAELTVAKYLVVATKTVYALCARGKLHHLRVLNAIRVAPQDLELFLLHAESEGTLL